MLDLREEELEYVVFLVNEEFEEYNLEFEYFFDGFVVDFEDDFDDEVVEELLLPEMAELVFKLVEFIPKAQKSETA